MMIIRIIFVVLIYNNLNNLLNDGNPFMQRNMVANVPIHPYQHIIDVVKLHQIGCINIGMILVSGQAALVLHDTFAVRVSIIFG